MAITEQGEAKWKALKYARVILKFFVLVFPPVCLSLVTVYNSVTYIHLKHTDEWVNITLKFPFKYVGQKTIIITNATLPEGLEFAPDLAISTWLFVGIHCVAFMVAVLALISYVCTHGNPNMDSVARIDSVISAMVGICIAIVSGLWIYHIVTLESNIYADVDKITNVLLYDDCVAAKQCSKHISDFTSLYFAGGISLFSVIIWILSTVESAKYGMTSMLAFQRDVTGILELNPDIGDTSIRT